MIKTRKVCFVITSVIHYSRNILLLEELKNNKNIELSIIICGSALLLKYVSKDYNIKNLLKKDGFDNIYEAYFYLDGNDAIAKAKTTGLGIIELSSLYNTIKPDLVVVRGDRFEVLSATIAAAYMNITIAHIEGGDLTGTLDEAVRHSITKLSHIHFVTNDAAKDRVIRLGENPNYVFNFGSLDIEFVEKYSETKQKIKKNTGSGYNNIDINKPYIIVMHHPVSTELSVNKKNTIILLNLIKKMNIPTFWFWPNVDAGSEDVSHELRIFRDNNPDAKIKFMRYLPPKKFLYLLNNCKCLIGNSSAGIKECSYLGVPVVNISTRQNKRLRADNVMDVDFNEEKIIEAINKQIQIRYPKSSIYYKSNTARNMMKILKNIRLYTQKGFFD